MCQLARDSVPQVGAGGQALDWGPMPTCEKKVLMTVGVTASDTVVVDSLVMAAGVHFQMRGETQSSKRGALHSQLEGDNNKCLSE